MRFMHSIFCRCAVSTDSTGRAQPAIGPLGCGAPILGWFAQVRCDDVPIFSMTREEV